MPSRHPAPAWLSLPNRPLFFRLLMVSSTTARFFEDNLCEGRPPALRAECKATLATALAPAKLSCMSAFHDVVLCQHPADNGGGGGNKRRCRKEQQKRSECLQVCAHAFGTVLGWTSAACATEICRLSCAGQQGHGHTISNVSVSPVLGYKPQGASITSATDAQTTNSSSP